MWGDEYMNTKLKINLLVILVMIMITGCKADGKGYDSSSEHLKKSENFDQIKTEIEAERNNENSINSEKINIEETDKKEKLVSEEIVDTIENRIKAPENFSRTSVLEDSFASYLRQLPLKSKGSIVHYYNGNEKLVNNVYSDVVDMDIGDQNLQQCADAVMRLRAEYLLKAEKSDDIHFNLTNGFNVPYKKWKAGERVVVEGNETYWIKGADSSSTYESFREYMEFIFTYAGTLSLSQELESKEYMDMEIGDVLIKGGSPGHCVIVVDMVENTETHEKKYMLAQSYMPAQDIQILFNPEKENNVWYDLKETENIKTPEWTFDTNQLKKFSN